MIFVFIEENVKTKIVDSYDVAVCGGGFAGISAALAAARENGEKTGEYEIDFSPVGIDADSFPFNEWRKISRQVLNSENAELFNSIWMFAAVFDSLCKEM